MREPLPFDDPAADYADDPADLRPGHFDRIFVRANPLAALYLLLCPCVPLAPAVIVWSLCGVLACRMPAARRNAWLLLIVSAALTLLHVGLLLAFCHVSRKPHSVVRNDWPALSAVRGRV
jgi:hypothetical protein